MPACVAPSPGADVAGVSPTTVADVDVEGVDTVLLQMRQGVSPIMLPSPAQPRAAPRRPAMGEENPPGHSGGWQSQMVAFTHATLPAAAACSARAYDAFACPSIPNACASARFAS